MSYSVANAKDDLAGILHGTTTKKVTNITGVFNRAARKVIARLNPDELKRVNQLEIYDGVFDYAAFSDLNEKRIADIKVQQNRSQADNFTAKLDEQFDLRKTSNWFSISDQDGVKRIKISKRFTPPARSLFAFTDITGWNLTGDGSGLATDRMVVAKAGLSFKLNLSDSGATVTIEGPITSADLSDLDQFGDLFLRLYQPNSNADITGVTMRWGNDDANYWEAAGVSQIGSLLRGWNLFKFDWSAATETGSVDPTAVDYVRITIAFDDTAVNGIRIDDLFISQPNILDVSYFSKFMFRDANTGVWKVGTTSDNDLINLDEGSYNIFLYECAVEASQQRQGNDAAADRKHFNDMLHGNSQQEGFYSLYQFNNPDQVQRPRNSYYRVK